MNRAALLALSLTLGSCGLFGGDAPEPEPEAAPEPEVPLVREKTVTVALAGGTMSVGGPEVTVPEGFPVAVATLVGLVTFRQAEGTATWVSGAWPEQDLGALFDTIRTQVVADGWTLRDAAETDGPRDPRIAAVLADYYAGAKAAGAPGAETLRGSGPDEILGVDGPARALSAGRGQDRLMVVLAGDAGTPRGTIGLLERH